MKYPVEGFVVHSLPTYEIRLPSLNKQEAAKGYYRTLRLSEISESEYRAILDALETLHLGCLKDI